MAPVVSCISNYDLLSASGRRQRVLKANADIFSSWWAMGFQRCSGECYLTGKFPALMVNVSMLSILF